MERTLVIIKPNCIKKRCIGKIISRFEQNSLKIIGMKMMKLTKDEAENFYYVHRGKPFFDNLVGFMTSDICIPMLLEGDNIIEKVRELIGHTDPGKACKGSIRADYGDNIEKNAVHASDGAETSKFEVNFFFPEFAWE